jgi:hypothetical protein
VPPMGVFNRGGNSTRIQEGISKTYEAYSSLVNKLQYILSFNYISSMIWNHVGMPPSA